MVVFADTSALIEVVNPLAPLHAKFVETLIALDARLVTSDFVFDETVTLLLYRLGLGPAVEAGEALMGRDIGVIRVTRVDELEAWKLFRTQKSPRPREGLSFTDCTSFALMRRLGLSRVFTKDDDFREAGFTVIPSRP